MRCHRPPPARLAERSGAWENQGTPSMQAADRRTLTVPPFAAGDRLDGFLQRHGGEPERSRSEWQRLIGMEAVWLNGQPSKPGQRVISGDRVLIAAATRQIDLPPAEDVPFAVVFED